MDSAKDQTTARTKVHFVSGGIECAAWHYPGTNGACVVMAGGFAVTMGPGTDAFAARFRNFTDRNRSEVLSVVDETRRGEEEQQRASKLLDLEDLPPPLPSRAALPPSAVLARLRRNER